MTADAGPGTGPTVPRVATGGCANFGPAAGPATLSHLRYHDARGTHSFRLLHLIRPAPASDKTPSSAIRSQRPFLRLVRAGTILCLTYWLSVDPALAERAARGVAAPADLAILCDQAADQASRESGVPVSVLRAITLTETGRQKNGALRPWPWTVNMEGAGVWFDTPEEAKAYVARHHERGARSYDVGCFQLNYRWHGRAFASIDEMFDPLTNARYAARFLTELFAETGDWSRAAGAYHSRTPRYANRYRARFDRIRARLDGTTPPPEPTLADAAPLDGPPIVVAAAPPERVRINTFPLLQTNTQPSALGSLVPLSLVPTRRLIDPTEVVQESDDAG